MTDNTDYFLDRAKRTFLSRLDLIDPHAAKWLQYREAKIDLEKDTATLYFKTSSYGISFEVDVRLFTATNDGGVKALNNFSEVYEYFRSAKYTRLAENEEKRKEELSLRLLGAYLSHDENPKEAYQKLLAVKRKEADTYADYYVTLTEALEYSLSVNELLAEIKKDND